ncbi:hypothetical protein K490DRAFT_66598 [Saccharata proteae CBS 121410]|uniref:Peptidase M48 domain-containing protein n=1 Tax=Saccharata proteae CBS 121410 TaxID=1314787 RepID=A0A9P4HUY8_9PEZI|nr:hypothetical protein K490DRAFT_66598 [Saccharata proteae CBS 121410]
MLASRFLRSTAAARRPTCAPSAARNVRYQGYYRGRPRYVNAGPKPNILQRWAARPTFYYEVGGLAAATGVFVVANTEVVPVSGRRRFNLVSEAMEEAAGEKAYQEALRAYGPHILPAWDSRSRMVNRVMSRLIPVSGYPNADWKVHVIDDPMPNAFVIPGGKVFVFSGILPICGNEDGLAAVLGHEIAHNVAHHMAEKMTKSSILRLVGLLADFALLASGVGVTGLSRNVLDLAFEKPGSRSQESEADYIGLMMMARACYNPEAAAHMWATMEKVDKEGASVPQFLSTHPAHQNRQKKIREWLPEAKDKQMESDCSQTAGFGRNSPAWELSGSQSVLTDADHAVPIALQERSVSASVSASAISDDRARNAGVVQNAALIRAW